MKNKQLPSTLTLIALFAAAVAIRLVVIPRGNIDMGIISKWYDYVAANGIQHALSDVYSNYPPAYIYFLILAALTRPFLPEMTALKLVPMLFEPFAAFVIYKLVRLKYPSGRAPIFAAALFLLLPTVVMNSSMWGQVDIIYTSFLLLCLYFLLTDHPIYAMLAFGISFSFKGQAIFLIPFLAVWILKKRIPIWTVGLVPLVYVLLALPTLLAGRNFWEVALLYFNRVDLFTALAMHAPNLYSLVPARFVIPPVLYAGFACAAIGLGTWTLYYSIHKFSITPRTLLLTALLSAVLVPFLLPRMHDRFFFPADLIAFVLAFFVPSYWFVAVGYQIISSLVYYIFLFSVTNAQNKFILRTAVLLNTLMVAYLIIRQWLETRKEDAGG
jgi:Gpi18-like mannosyltransferase